jgi:hypothetical protein
MMSEPRDNLAAITRLLTAHPPRSSLQKAAAGAIPGVGRVIGSDAKCNGSGEVNQAHVLFYRNNTKGAWLATQDCHETAPGP